MQSLLENAGRRLGLDLRYFASSGAWVSGRYILVGLIGLASSIGFARLGMPELYGQYQYVLAVTGLISIVTLPGLNTVALRGVAKGELGIVRTTTAISFRLSIVAAFLLAGFGLYTLSFLKQPAIGWSFILASFFVPAFYAPNAWYTLYEGRLRFDQPTIRIVALSFLSTTTLLLGLTQGWTIVGLVGGYFFVNAFFTALYYFEAERQIPGKQSVSINLKEGVFFSLQKLSLLLAETVQPILISHLFGYEVLGYFVIAFTLVNALSGLLTALASTYFPLFLKYKRLAHLRFVVINLFLGAGAMIAYLLLVSVGFLPLYGEAYAASLSVALWLAGTVLLLPLRAYFTNYLSAMNQPNTLIATNITAYLAAASVFLLMNGGGWEKAVLAYFYVLQLTSVMLLAGAYIYTVRRGAQS